MKNLFFALAFMLAGAFSFANTINAEYNSISAVEYSETISKIGVEFDTMNILSSFDVSEISEQNQNILIGDEYQCYRLYINGQFVGYVCGNSLAEVIDNILTLLE